MAHDDLQLEGKVVLIIGASRGIGAATAVFSAVEGLVLNPYPYSGADRLVVMSQAEGAGPSRRTFLTGDQARLLTQAGSLDAVLLWDESWMWTKNEGIPEMVYGGKLSQNVFQLLGVPPLVGRTFGDDSSPVAVLNYRYWQTRFAGAADVIGRTVQVDGRPHTIIGVMPERFRFLNVAFYIPLPSGNDRRWTLLRLRPGVSRAAATAELQAVVQQQFGERREVRVSLTTLRDYEAGNLQNMLGILLGAVTLLFVIGCANVSILLVGRGIHRRYELAVRRAVGASQARILRQLLTESLVVSMAGGVVGVEALRRRGDPLVLGGRGELAVALEQRLAGGRHVDGRAARGGARGDGKHEREQERRARHGSLLWVGRGPYHGPPGDPSAQGDAARNECIQGLDQPVEALGPRGEARGQDNQLISGKTELFPGFRW